MIRGVNILALLVLVTAAVLTGIGKLEPESFMLLVTGLAIPARADGYQNVGTGPLRVEGVPGGTPVPVEDAETGAGELRLIGILAAGGLLGLVFFYFVAVPLLR